MACGKRDAAENAAFCLYGRQPFYPKSRGHSQHRFFGRDHKIAKRSANDKKQVMFLSFCDEIKRKTTRYSRVFFRYFMGLKDS